MFKQHVKVHVASYDPFKLCPIIIINNFRNHFWALTAPITVQFKSVVVKTHFSFDPPRIFNHHKLNNNQRAVNQLSLMAGSQRVSLETALSSSSRMLIKHSCQICIHQGRLWRSTLLWPRPARLFSHNSPLQTSDCMLYGFSLDQTQWCCSLLINMREKQQPHYNRNKCTCWMQLHNNYNNHLHHASFKF